MATGTWALGWATGDVVSAAEFGKGVGCIYDTTLGAGAVSIDVTGIVGLYAHLLVVAYPRSDTAATSTDIVLRFNADSGSNYGYSTTPGPVSTTSGSSLLLTSAMPAASATAGVFGAMCVVIPHYANTSNHKSACWMAGHGGGSNTIAPGAGVWRNTAALNRITISAAAGNLIAGTRFSIYGMGA
jgi:hypothetical protein